MNRRQFTRKVLYAGLAAAFSPWASAAMPPFKKGVLSKKPVRQPAKSSHPVAQPVSHGGPVFQSTPSTAPIPANAVNVKKYGARGDGVTNDTDAFNNASAEINRRGGGTLYIPPGTYIVGKQTLTGAMHKDGSWVPAEIISITGCQKPVYIRGSKGTRLVADKGLRFGAFDPVTGQPYLHGDNRFTDSSYAADCYYGMVNLHDNAYVEVHDLELDGNINNIILGGVFGDTGYQLNATGVFCERNKKLLISNVYSHHHGEDGVFVRYMTMSPNAPATPATLINVVCDSNARQGMSWCGGIGLTAINCKFINTGKVPFHSSPAAGVDIEPDYGVCRNGLFINCFFANNHGVGFLADSNDTAHITCRNCTFWGNTNWALWPNKPYMTFYSCHIHGAIVDFYTAPPNQPDARVHFVNCIVDNAPSPVYGPCYPYNGMVLGYGHGDATWINTSITSNGQLQKP